MSFADWLRKFVVYKEMYTLVSSLAALLVFLVFFIIIGVPWFAYLFIAFIFVILLLNMWSIKRIATVSLEEKPLPIKQDKTSLNAEKIEASVFGVAKSFSSGYELLGVGEVSNPENAILVTNKRIILFTVPMAGAGKIVAGVDFSTLYFLFGRAKIEEKGRQMLATMNPQQILEFDKANYEILLTQIKEAKITHFWGRGITITSKTSKKVKYTVRRKKELEQLKKALSKYLPGKVR